MLNGGPTAVEFVFRESPRGPHYPLPITHYPLPRFIRCPIRGSYFFRNSSAICRHNDSGEKWNRHSPWRQTTQTFTKKTPKQEIYHREHRVHRGSCPTIFSVCSVFSVVIPFVFYSKCLSVLGGHYFSLETPWRQLAEVSPSFKPVGCMLMHNLSKNRASGGALRFPGR